MIKQRGGHEETSDSKVSSFPPELTADGQSEEVKNWLEFVGAHEDGESFADVLTKDQAFRDFADASCLNDQKKLWFQNIILGSDDSQNFDELCQQVNKKLLECHAAISFEQVHIR